MAEIPEEMITVCIGGGEPTLHKRLPRLIEILCESISPKYFSLMTNGSKPIMTEAVFDTTMKTDVDLFFLGISLDALGELHNKMRNTPRAFDNVIETLNLVRRLKERDERLIPVISYTITPWNYEELLKIFYFSLNWQAGFNFRFAQPKSCFDFDEEILSSVKKQLAVISGILNRAPEQKMAAQYSLRYLEGLIPHFRTGKRPQPCNSPESAILIDAYGDAYPCTSSAWMTGRYGNEEYKLGNMLDSTLKELHNSEGRRRVMEKLKDCQMCWDECSYHTIAPEYMEEFNLFNPPQDVQ